MMRIRGRIHPKWGRLVMSPVQNRIVGTSHGAGDAPVRLLDQYTSVSWLRHRVKGIKVLRLNQGEEGMGLIEMDE